MNKKLYIFIFSLLFVGLVGAIPVNAQTEAELPSPGLTPDSPFYFLERFFEGVGTFFTFGDVAKAERYAKLAAERIAEAKAVVDKGKPEVAEKALTRYQDQLEKSLAKADQAQAKGKDTTTVEQLVARATTHHLEVLNDVYNKVPEQAKAAIEKAMTVSETGHQRAVESLKEKGALENIPGIVPAVPREVREKVFQERKIPKPEIPKREEEVEKPEIEVPEKPKIEKSEAGKPEVGEVEKPEVKEVEKPETPKISPGPPAQSPRP